MNMEAQSQLPVASSVLQAAQTLSRIRAEVQRVIVGQGGLLDGLLVSLLAGGHVLLEGVPGLAKTLTVKTLAQAVACEFRRVQFTPDLLPADVTGTQVYDERSRDFFTRQGPVFANLLLADEINRAPAKVQSALLEAMQERQVTIGGETLPLPDPFMVLATQNPIEQEGTYPLPEAQVDRFMLKLLLGYPDRAEELSILRRWSGRVAPEPGVACTVGDILAARDAVHDVHMDERIEQYIVSLVWATREPAKAAEESRERLRARRDLNDAQRRVWEQAAQNLEQCRDLIEYGASPRASIFLALTARAHAVLQGRGFVLPDDVIAVAPAVLRHRVIVSYEAEAEGINTDQIVERVLRTVVVP
jgi:MoxR-like ATPase